MFVFGTTSGGKLAQGLFLQLNSCLLVVVEILDPKGPRIG